MNQPLYETVTRSIPARRQVKIRSVHRGSTADGKPALNKEGSS